ncbi:hypothetical protein PTI98_006443 [Pleurotus ostreatus]|nr:hypothetical protein PTI98_006443 [Pleurotus ostreatus]
MQNHTTKPAIPRTNSAIRAVPSKDHVPPAQPKRKVSEQTQHKLHVPNYRPNGKPKAGFMIASPADEDDEDDEDAWISTESGAVTPSGHESESDDSDAATQARTPIDKPKVVKPLNSTYDKPKPPLTLHLDDPRPLDRVELLTNGFSDLTAIEDPRRDAVKPDGPTTTARPLGEAIRTAPPAHDQFPTTAVQQEVTQLRPPEQPPLLPRLLLRLFPLHRPLVQQANAGQDHHPCSPQSAKQITNPIHFAPIPSFVAIHMASRATPLQSLPR